MSEVANAVNVYWCNNGHHTVTRNRDEGTTPFMIGCPSCKAVAYSSFYRVDQTLTPTHEFYRPDEAEIDAEISTLAQQIQMTARSPREAKSRVAALAEDVREHVQMGGLLMRRIPS